MKIIRREQHGYSVFILHPGFAPQSHPSASEGFILGEYKTVNVRRKTLRRA
jgi:hypothetical protein